MKIFISYSAADTEFIKKIADYLRPHVEPLYWQQNKVPGEDDWKTIFQWIDQSKIVLAVISDSALVRGISVGQEIGYAKKCGKTIIPFISKSINISDVGFLKGTTAVHFDHNDPSGALNELNEAISKHKSKMEGDDANVLFGVGVILLLFLSASK